MNNMEIMGALSKGHTQSTIYFCPYNHSSLEKAAIQKLVDDTDYSDEIHGDDIEILAIESKDEMKSDIRLVGLIFKDETNFQHKSIVLKNYTDLRVYLYEMVE